MTVVKTSDDYLAGVPDEARAALEDLRAKIRAAASEATEGISYGVLAFKHHGSLVSFGAAKNHCAFYVQSPTVMAAHATDLAGYDTAKGTVRFDPAKRLSASLVTKLVKARVAENEAAHRKTTRKQEGVR